MYPYICCGIVHNSQDREATQLSAYRWIGKESVVYMYNKVLFSHKKEGDIAIYYNMDQPRVQYYAKLNKAEKDKYQTLSFICWIYKTKWETKSETDP